jgi:hypothetical protein
MNDPSQQTVQANEHHEHTHTAEGVPNPPAPVSGEKGKQRAGDRLNIPSSVVRTSGFVPGDKVFVADEDPAGVISKPCLMLVKQQPPKFLSDYVVAKDCRIRVTPATLKKCGLEGVSFDIDGGVGKIVVRPRRAP